MNPAVQFLQKNWKTILAILVIIIIYYIAKRNWYKIRHIFQEPSISNDNVTGYTSVNSIPDQRKQYLESLAKKIYSDIYDTSWGGHNGDLYKEADALSDIELIYLAQYYRRYITRGNPLYLDISDDYFPFTDVGSIMAHLSKIGEA